jgi:hypothetical protein
MISRLNKPDIECYITKTMKKLSIPFILPFISFLIPVNIYIIGDWMAVGIQWALFRYQLSNQGLSVISLGNDVGYILMGILQTKTLISTLLWFGGAGLLLLCICSLLKDFQKQTPDPYNKQGKLVLISACLFLVADVVQYGVVLHSEYSSCIPVGIPVLLLIGFWEYKYAVDEKAGINHNIGSPFLKEKSSIFSRISRYCHTPQFQELVTLIVISVFIKVIVFSLSFFSPYELLRSDVRVYYNYASLVLGGKIPYIDFGVEYPQLFFIPVLIASLPTLLIQNFTVYSWSFQVLMYAVDISTLVCVYLIADRLFGQNRAFLCGLLYATAFSAVYFIPLTYDIFPTFIVTLSFLFFICRNEMATYVSTTVGVLVKWFPAFCFPFFFIHSIKNRDDLRPTIRGIVFSAILVPLIIGPLLLIQPALFLKTYTVQLNRPADPHSIIYYLDAICSFLFHIRPFSGISLFLLVMGECALVAWYYRFLDAKQVTLLISIFLSIFFFMSANSMATPTYIIWITPFLALLLINSRKEIILFYLIQLVMYAEAPVLNGIVWAANKDYSVIENSLLSFPFIFYTVKYAVFVFVMVYFIQRVYRNNREETGNAVQS